MITVDKTERVKRAIAKKMRFTTSVVLCSIGCYLCLPLTIAFFPQAVHISIYHHFHLGWILSFAQFAITWGVCSFYLYKGKRFDDEIEHEFDGEHTL